MYRRTTAGVTEIYGRNWSTNSAARSRFDEDHDVIMIGMSVYHTKVLHSHLRPYPEWTLTNGLSRQNSVPVSCFTYPSSISALIQLHSLSYETCVPFSAHVSLPRKSNIPILCRRVTDERYTEFWSGNPLKNVHLKGREGAGRMTWK